MADGAVCGSGVDLAPKCVGHRFMVAGACVVCGSVRDG